MNKASYDTRFFIELFYTKNDEIRQKIKNQKQIKEKYVSTVVLHEIFRLTLLKEGKQTALHRTNLIKKDFKTIPVDEQIAQTSATLRHKYNLSMGDSMIAATANILKAACITDDPHFKKIKEISSTWI